MGITTDMSADSLFDDFRRKHNGVANHSEGTFSFLNRSARPASEGVRDLLNQWYARYPNQHKLDLTRRFRTDFSVGFFELLLHEVLLHFQYQVEVHPILTTSQRSHPDFRAKTSVGDVLFLEATIATDESEQEKAKNKALAVLYDQISQIHLPDYFLDIDRIDNPTGRQPSGKKLRNFISRSVQDLNYEALIVLSQLGAINDLPRWTYKEGQLEIDFSVIPVSKENRGKPNHRPIGIYPGGTRWGGSDGAIRDKIMRKAGKYGRLSTPYVIAVNCLGGFGTHRGDQIKALFGTEEPFFLNSSTEPKLEGTLNGAWYGSKGPRHMRVSAVLLTRVFPWNLPIADVTLYHNPWADYPYEGSLIELPQVRFSADKIYSVTGKSFGSILSLTNDWPGQLFDN